MARIHSPQTESAQPSRRLAALIFRCVPAGHICSPWVLFVTTLCAEARLRGYMVQCHLISRVIGKVPTSTSPKGSRRLIQYFAHLHETPRCGSKPTLSA